jgi:hypothetical protein
MKIFEGFFSVPQKIKTLFVKKVDHAELVQGLMIRILGGPGGRGKCRRRHGGRGQCRRRHRDGGRGVPKSRRVHWQLRTDSADRQHAMARCPARGREPGLTFTRRRLARITVCHRDRDSDAGPRRPRRRAGTRTRCDRDSDSESAVGRSRRRTRRWELSNATQSVTHST